MAEHAIDATEIAIRIMNLKPEHETAEEFYRRCGFTADQMSRWKRGKAGITSHALMKIMEANPDASLDVLVLGRPRAEAPHDKLERLAADVVDAVNQTMTLLQGRRAAPFVRLPRPDGKDPG